MQGWRDVPMPAEIAALPRDDRGFPITFVTLIAADGRPDFTTIDGKKIVRCILEQVCGLCGTLLLDKDDEGNVAFIGGPLSIQHRNFFDPPMHEACASYAMEVCPHIVHDTSRYKKQDLSDGVRTAVEEVSDERPDRFGMLVADVNYIGLARTSDGQPVFLVDDACDPVVRWQDEPWLDDEGHELERYIETRYYRLPAHVDGDGEQCAVDTTVYTTGRHRKAPGDTLDTGLVGMICVGCSVMHKLERVTDPAEIARLTNPSEED